MGPKKTQKLLLLAKQIVHLENELAFLRAEFARLAGEQDSEGGYVDDATAFSTADVATERLALRPLARTSTLPDRVLSALDLSGASLTAQDIAAQVGAPLDSVRSALSKLVNGGSVARVSPGLYRSTAGGHRRAAGEDD